MNPTETDCKIFFFFVRGMYMNPVCETLIIQRNTTSSFNTEDDISTRSDGYWMGEA